MSEQQRAREVSNCKWKEIDSCPRRRHIVEAGENEPVGEENRVVKKGLRCNQYEAKQRAPAKMPEDRLEHDAQRGVWPRLYGQRRSGRHQRHTCFALDA